MKGFHLPRPLQQRVLAYALHSFLTVRQHEQVQSFLDLLAPSLRRHVLTNVCRDALRRSTLLSTLADTDADLRFLMLHPDQSLFSHGDAPDGVYFVIRG